MKLLSSSQIDRLQQQYIFGCNLDRQDAVVKIYDPCGPGTWYLLNQNPESPDCLWAIVRNIYVEVKIVSLLELEAYRGKPMGLPLDRDPYFMQMRAMDLWEKIWTGKHI